MVLAKPKPIKEVKVRKPRKKKSSRQLYERELDTLVRSIVIFRDKFCVCPPPKNGHSVVLQPGHLITRGKESVKWDLRNVHCQCSGCNLTHEFRPERFTNWYIQRFTADSYMTLVADSEEVCKMSVDELMELRSQLTEIHRCQLEDKLFKPYFTQKQILTGEWRGNDS
jgi:hypothetical protein